MNNAAYDYLKQNYLLNIDIIESLRRGDSEVLSAGDDGALVREKAGELYFLSCESTAAAKRLADGYDIKLCVLHGCEHKGEICRMLGMNSGDDCYQVAYIKNEPVPQHDADIRVLDKSYTDFVADIYSRSSPEHIRAQLERGILYGVFVDNEIAGFMGRHNEGSMGMLEILPKFRRRGLAESIEAWYINMLMAQGEVPYAQVYTYNEPSLDLQRKLGMDVSDRCICWLWKND